MNNMYNPYMQNYGYNYGYNQPMQQQRNNEQTYYPQYKQPILQGKSVDSIEVAKVMDIPLEGVSYFPIADGSAIVTKQLQMDGTSKIVIYKPFVETKEENKEKVVYLTKEDLQEEVKTLKEQIDFLVGDIKEIKKLASDNAKAKERSSK